MVNAAFENISLFENGIILGYKSKEQKKYHFLKSKKFISR